MSRMMRWAGHVAYTAEKMSAYRVREGKPDATRQLKRPRCRWENNINMDLREMVWGNGLDLSGSVYGLVAGSSEHSTESTGSIKYWEFLQRLSEYWIMAKHSTPWSLSAINFVVEIFVQPNQGRSQHEAGRK
jgi:hypothetical protein